jgi:uncharacterized protein YggT (Ycf19 family)
MTYLYTIFNFLVLINLAVAEIRVSEKNIILGDTFDLYIDSEDESSIEGLDNFNIISRSSSRSFSSINGKLSVNSEMKLILSAKIKGIFKLKDKNSSKIIEINVSADKNNHSFIEIDKFKDHLYKNEKFLLKYRLLSKREVATAKFAPFVNLKNINCKSIDILDSAVTKYVGLDRYSVWNIDYLVLNVSATGEIDIPSRTMDLEILNKRAFYGRFIPMKIESERLSVNIKDLPEYSDPKANIIVGHVDLSFEKEDIDDLHMDDSFSLKVALKGSANLDGISEIYGKVPNFRVFQQVVSFKESVENNKYHSEKIFEIIFSPTKSGDLVIPEIEIVYFDTFEEVYKKVSVPSFELKVNEIDKEIVSVIVEERGETFSEIIYKYRKILLILIMIILTIVLRYSIFLLLNSSKRKNIFKILKEKKSSKIFDILRKILVESKGIDISTTDNENIIKVFGDKTAKLIIDFKTSVNKEVILDEIQNKNIKHLAIKIIHKL